MQNWAHFHDGVGGRLACQRRWDELIQSAYHMGKAHEKWARRGGICGLRTFRRTRWRFTIVQTVLARECRGRRSLLNQGRLACHRTPSEEQEKIGRCALVTDAEACMTSESLFVSGRQRRRGRSAISAALLDSDIRSAIGMQCERTIWRSKLSTREGLDGCSLPFHYEGAGESRRHTLRLRRMHRDFSRKTIGTGATQEIPDARSTHRRCARRSRAVQEETAA